MVGGAARTSTRTDDAGHVVTFFPLATTGLPTVADTLCTRTGKFSELSIRIQRVPDAPGYSAVARPGMSAMPKSLAPLPFAAVASGVGVVVYHVVSTTPVIRSAAAAPMRHQNIGIPSSRRRIGRGGGVAPPRPVRGTIRRSRRAWR